MKTPLYFLLIGAFSLAPLYSKEIKVATYNVQNLFDLKNDGTEYREFIPNRNNWNRVNLDKKLNNISEVICDLNADVLGLQEIENQNALNELLKALDRKGCSYKYSAITNKKRSAIQVALISKIPIKKDKFIEVYSRSRYPNRDILEVELDTKIPLTIFVNHWRSKRAKESERVYSAKALIKRIKELPRDREYIILGDFNSEYNECSDIDYKFNDTKSICGIDTVLKTIYKGRIIKLRERPKLKLFHYNLWEDFHPHKRWSHDFYGKKGAIDSIIISANLNDNINWRYKKGSFGVFRKKYLFKKNSSMLNRWGYDKYKHKGDGYSDHLPIYARFTDGKKEELKYETLTDKILKFIIPSVEYKETSKNKKSRAYTLQEIKRIKELISINLGRYINKDRDRKTLNRKILNFIIPPFKDEEIKESGESKNYIIDKIKTLLPLYLNIKDKKVTLRYETLVEKFFKFILLSIRDKKIEKDKIVDISKIKELKNIKYIFPAYSSFSEENGRLRYENLTYAVLKSAILFSKSSISSEEMFKRYILQKLKDINYLLPLYIKKFENNYIVLEYQSLTSKLIESVLLLIKDGKILRYENLLSFTLEELKEIRYLKEPILLRDVCLIYKRGDFGVIKSSPNSKSISLYKSADGLEEGRCYDFKVYEKIRYFGIDEITDLDILREKNKIDVELYIPKFNVSMLNPKEDNIGEIVKDIRGRYESKHITVDGRRIKIFVKKRKRGLLRKGNILNIKRAQIILYKGEKELTIHSLDDIKKEY